MRLQTICHRQQRLKVVDLIEHAPAKLPEALAIDEFRGNAEGERFQCILAGSKNHKVLDILPSRKHEDIYAYLGKFHSRNDAKVVAMDMTGACRSLMKRLFPQATIVIDKYHYVRQVGFAIEKARIGEQKQYSDRWRKYFKRSRTVLLKNPASFTTGDRIQMENMFRISPKLKSAYELKQMFGHFTGSSTRKEAQLRLEKFIMASQESGLEPFSNTSLTFQRWSKEMLNSFDHPYTNGYIEECNNRIKVLKRVSFGMPRFKRFRRRILHIMVK